MPSAPDWRLAWRPGPARGAYGRERGVRCRPPAVLTTPMQLGPTMRMPLRRASSHQLALRGRAPSAPVSAKPAVITTSAPHPLRRALATTSRTGGAARR